MNASSLLSFNKLKLATQLALWPATVTFAATGSTSYAVTFGEIENDGQLHDSGQAIQHHRLGVLTFPLIDGVTFRPALLHVVTIVTSSQPDLIGKSYRLTRQLSAPGEPSLKFQCTRIEA